jgi:hypothetical protein
MIIARESVFFGLARELFNEDGIKDKAFDERVEKMLDEVTSLARGE